MTSQIEFDPARLLGLKRRLDDARALVRAGNDRYQDLRMQAQELRLKASLVGARAYDPNARKSAEAERDRLNGEADAIADQMVKIEADTTAKAGVANNAARIFKSALNLAVETGLAVPAELASEVNALRGNSALESLAIAGAA